MTDILLFLIFSPMGVPIWVFLIAWLAFKLDVFRFLRKEVIELADKNDPPIYK
jgi:hypothetical protein